MKKILPFLLFAALVCTACNNKQKEPEIDNSYLPRLCWQLAEMSLEDANATLTQEKFMLDQTNPEEGLLYSRTTDNGTKQQIYFNIINDSLTAVIANQPIAATDCANLFADWDKLCREKHAGYSFWGGSQINGDSVTVYLDGQVVAAATAALAAALVLKQITQEQYDMAMQMFEHSRTDFLTDLQTYNFEQEGATCAESFINVTDMQRKEGFLSAIYYGTEDFESDEDYNGPLSGLGNINMLDKGMKFAAAKGVLNEFIPDINPIALPF